MLGGREEYQAVGALGRASLLATHREEREDGMGMP